MSDVHHPRCADPAPVEAWIRRFIDKPCDDLVLMTGEGLRRLMKVVRRLDLEKQFVAALGTPRCSTLPKPGRALREVGLEPQVTPRNPLRKASPRRCRASIFAAADSACSSIREGSRRPDRLHHRAGRRVDTVLADVYDAQAAEAKS